MMLSRSISLQRLLVGATSLGVVAAVLLTMSPSSAAPVLPPAPPGSFIIGADYLGINASGISDETAPAINKVVGASGKLEPIFGTIRYWDDPPSVSTRWCDVQPTENADVEANLRQRLDPKLDVAARYDLRRVIIVLGHPAPWVFGAASGQPQSGTFRPWYCGGEISSVTMPSTQYMYTNGQPARFTQLWSSYVSTVIRHISNHFNGKIPFDVDFQTANEPGSSVQLTSTVPNRAETAEEAARSLVSMDNVVRYHLRTLPNIDRKRFGLLTSPLAAYSHRRPIGVSYWAQANAAQARSRIYDGVSMQTYSQRRPNVTTAVELIQAYNQGSIKGLTAGLSRLPALRGLPRLQTETNHGLTLPDGSLLPGKTTITPAEEAILLSRLIVDGLRWGMRSQNLYALNPSLQFATGIVEQPNGNFAATLEAAVALLITRSWIVGSRFEGCAVAAGVVKCTLRNVRTARPSYVLFSESGLSMRVRAPMGTRTMATVSNDVTRFPAGARVTIGPAPRLFS